MSGRHQVTVRAELSGTRLTPMTFNVAICRRCGARYALASGDYDHEMEARFDEVFPSCDEELVRKVMES